jgi:hypothetical protein
MRDVRDTGKKPSPGDSAVRGYSRRRASVDSRLGEPVCLDGPHVGDTRTRSARRKMAAALAQSLLRRARAVFPANRPCLFRSTLSEVTPSTGEPDAGNPPVRFGGRGAATQCGLPTSIHQTSLRDSDENGLSVGGDSIARAVPFAGRTPGPSARMPGLQRIICRRRLDYQGGALRWENAWAFGPQVIRPACLVCPERHPFIRPACSPGSRRDCAGLTSLALLDVRWPKCVAPKGRRFAQRRATPWLRKTSTAAPSCHHSVFRPNGPTVLLQCGLLCRDARDAHGESVFGVRRFIAAFWAPM